MFAIRLYTERGGMISSETYLTVECAEAAIQSALERGTYIGGEVKGLYANRGFTLRVLRDAA